MSCIWVSNHSEFIFVYGVRECSNFIDLCRCPDFPRAFVEETVFSPLYSLASFVIDSLIVGIWVYFCTFFSAPLIYMSVFVPIPCCFDYCSFVVLSEVCKGYASIFVLLPHGCFGNLGSSVVLHKFWYCLF